MVNVSGIVDDYAMRQLAIMNKQRNFWPVCLGVHTFNFEKKLNELNDLNELDEPNELNDLNELSELNELNEVTEGTE